MKTPTPLQQLKAEKHNKRFLVIASINLESGNFRVQSSYALDDAEFATRVFNGRYKDRPDGLNREYALGIALCNVSRTGKISWGLFEAL
jgi:hypothetical protein